MRTTYSRGNSRGIRIHSHLFVSCKLCVKTPNKAKNDRRITGRTTAKKPVKPHSHCAGVATVHPDAGQPVYRDAPGHIS